MKLCDLRCLPNDLNSLYTNISNLKVLTVIVLYVQKKNKVHINKI